MVVVLVDMRMNLKNKVRGEMKGKKSRKKSSKEVEVKSMIIVIYKDPF